MTIGRLIGVCLLVLAGCGGSNPVGNVNGNENTNENTNGNGNGNGNETGCGNGVVEGAEVCDDGNDANNDGCLSACLGADDCCVPNVCGDGHVDETPVGQGWQVEVCDDGNTEDGDLCRGDCGQDYTLCGNGLLDQGEGCDLGGQNADAPNAQCRRSCQPSGCGDGILDDQLGEACDDGPDNADTVPNACRTDCAAPGCGDWVVDDLFGEGCDDGPSNSDVQPDACRTSCSLPGCGDDVADTGEQCDDSDLGGANCGTLGYGGGTLACRSDCTFDETGCHNGICGNAVVELSEECDLFELDGETCQSLGFFGGTLACTVSCMFNTVGCFLPPTMPVGAPCLTDVDCNGGICMPEAGPNHWGPPGGYCYEPCDANNNCPGSGPNGLCVQFSGGASYCLQVCDPVNPSCRAGYDCLSIGSDAICMWGSCDNDNQCTITGDCDQDPTSDTLGWCISPPEICGNGVDDDFDGLLDCADPECWGMPGCTTETQCADLHDEDLDTLTDCADPDCAGQPGC